jgi:DMSO/TMAO reductase YedYZ molybdopterin-dependent catalytic subunit
MLHQVVGTPVYGLGTPGTPLDGGALIAHHSAVFDRVAWQLTLDGLVRRPFTIDYVELMQMPSGSYRAVLTPCGAGWDARASAAIGWREGLAVCGEWTGVALALLLERAELKQAARSAAVYGVDESAPSGLIDIAKLYDDAMLAYALDGQPLSPECGGPVRLVLPGRAGALWAANVSRLSLSSQVRQVLAVPPLPDTELTVTAEITMAAENTVMRAGLQPIAGYAWSAGRGIAQVEIDVGDGHGWRSAQLGDDQGPRAWRSFSAPWQAQPGVHRLSARAFDRAGNASAHVKPILVRVAALD